MIDQDLWLKLSRVTRTYVGLVKIVNGDPKPLHAFLEQVQHRNFTASLLDRNATEVQPDEGEARPPPPLYANRSALSMVLFPTNYLVDRIKRAEVGVEEMKKLQERVVAMYDDPRAEEVQGWTLTEKLEALRSYFVTAKINPVWSPHAKIGRAHV